MNLASGSGNAPSGSGSSSRDPAAAVLQLAPIVRQTVVKTITTCTISYPPIQLTRPTSPELTGEYGIDKTRYPIEVASRASGVKEAQSSVKMRLGKNEIVKATYTVDAKGQDKRQQQQQVVAGPSSGKQRATVDRKGKRRMREDEDDSTYAQEQQEELEDLAREKDYLRTQQALYDAREGVASTSSSSSSSSLSATAQAPPRKKSRLSATELASPATTPADEPLPFEANAEASTSQAYAQAGLPSPTMSPQLYDGDQEEQRQLVHAGPSSSRSAHKRIIHSKTREEVEPDVAADAAEEELAAVLSGDSPALNTLFHLNSLVNQFGNLSSSLQTSVLYQLLRRSSVRVLQDVNNIIQPALKRDFISDLPTEISLQILLHLDSKTILNGLSVSKNWKRFLDSQGKIWEGLLHKEDLWIGDSSRTEEKECEMFAELGTRNKKTGYEIGIKEIVQMTDEKSWSFMKRWKASANAAASSSMSEKGGQVWDEWFDEKKAALPTAYKIANATLEAEQQQRAEDFHRATASSSSYAANPSRGPTLRRTSTNISRINGKISTESFSKNTPDKSHPVHPMKILYKKRIAIRNRWRSVSEEPTHTVFRGEHKAVVTSLQFDNEKLVTASDAPFIEVYDTPTGKLKLQLKGHEGGVWALQYVGNILVSGSTDRTLRVWDLESGNCTHVFYGHTSTVRCLQIIEPVNVNPDKHGRPVWEPPYPLIVTGSRDSTLRVWRLPTPTKTTSLLPYGPPSPIDVGDYSSHGVGSSRHAPSLPENNPYHLRVLKGHSQAVRGLAAHGRTLVSGSYDYTLRVWDVLTGNCRWTLKGHDQKVYSVILDHERKRCASGSMDGTVRLWSIETGQSLFRLDGHSSLVGLLGLSFHYLVSAGADSTLKIWNPNDGTCMNTLLGNGGPITCFRHNDFRVVSGSDGQLRIWDIRKGQIIRDVSNDMTGVWQVQFNDRFCIAAVQRDDATDFEILDFFPELQEPTQRKYYSPQEWSEEEDDDSYPFGHGRPVTPPSRSNNTHKRVASTSTSMAVPDRARHSRFHNRFAPLPKRRNMNASPPRRTSQIVVPVEAAPPAIAQQEEPEVEEEDHEMIEEEQINAEEGEDGNSGSSGWDESEDYGKEGDEVYDNDEHNDLEGAQ